MKEAKRYPYRGEMITVKEAAQRAFVTVGAMRIRLSKCGGDMVRAIEGREPSDRLTAEERAEAEILSALTGDELTGAEEAPEGSAEQTCEGIAEASEESSEACEEIAEASEESSKASEEADEEEMEEGRMEMSMGGRTPDPTAEVNPAEIDITEEMGTLDRLNRAIEALSALHEEEVGGMANELTRLLYDLRMHRAMEFERYVDWDAVAKLSLDPAAAAFK